MPENLSPEAQGVGQPPAKKKMPVWAWILIGCGGLLAAVFLFSIIAAIAIPSLMVSRVSSLETAGVANLRAYATAQTMYRKTDWNGDGKLQYAAALPDLYNDSASGKQPRMVDAAMAGAHGPTGVPKQGYLFRECKTIGGKAIDPAADFALCAIPAAYGRTGRRAFIISTDGATYGKDLGPDGTFVDDFPADPVADGWTQAE